MITYTQAEKMKLSNKEEYPVDYIYRINLDERGSFHADVYRADTGKSVFEIRAGDGDESSIFEDGYMAHPHDLAGLQDYLIELGIMRPCDRLFDGP